MAEYIYPTRANYGDEWLKDMLAGWRESSRKFLCFPWIKFNVHTIRDPSFWLYMYYTHNETDIPDLRGVIEYRLSIMKWGLAKYQGADIHLARGEESGTAWFLADRFEGIQSAGGGTLGLADFRHADDKRLGSTIRNSIPPVVLRAKIAVTESYP